MRWQQMLPAKGAAHTLELFTWWGRLVENRLGRKAKTVATLRDGVVLSNRAKVHDNRRFCVPLVRPVQERT